MSKNSITDGEFVGPVEDLLDDIKEVSIMMAGEGMGADAFAMISDLKKRMYRKFADPDFVTRYVLMSCGNARTETSETIIPLVELAVQMRPGWQLYERGLKLDAEVILSKYLLEQKQNKARAERKKKN